MTTTAVGWKQSDLETTVVGRATGDDLAALLLARTPGAMRSDTPGAVSRQLRSIWIQL